jgi:hypothetical protein
VEVLKIKAYFLGNLTYHLDDVGDLKVRINYSIGKSSKCSYQSHNSYHN